LVRFIVAQASGSRTLSPQNRKLQIANYKQTEDAMNLEEIETLIEDTKRLPRAADKVALATALGVLEVARQLTIMNAAVAEQSKAGKK
jgi:hypothetical protein